MPRKQCRVSSNRHSQPGTESRPTAQQRRRPESDCGRQDADSGQRRPALAVRRWRCRGERRSSDSAVPGPNNTTHRTRFLYELCDEQGIEQATCLVDGATHMASVLVRLGVRSEAVRCGNRDSVERISRDRKRPSASFSNTFNHASLVSVESWIEPFAVYWNRRQT